jgi:hypothetical protein
MARGMPFAVFVVQSERRHSMKDERDRDSNRRTPTTDADKRGARVDKSQRSGALPHHLRGDELKKNFEDADADSADVTNRRDDKISES